jgi:hypothetical protein
VYSVQVSKPSLSFILSFLSYVVLPLGLGLELEFVLDLDFN